MVQNDVSRASFGHVSRRFRDNFGLCWGHNTITSVCRMGLMASICYVRVMSELADNWSPSRAVVIAHELMDLKALCPDAPWPIPRRFHDWLELKSARSSIGNEDFSPYQRWRLYMHAWIHTYTVRAHGRRLNNALTHWVSMDHQKHEFKEHWTLLRETDHVISRDGNCWPLPLSPENGSHCITAYRKLEADEMQGMTSWPHLQAPEIASAHFQDLMHRVLLIWIRIDGRGNGGWQNVGFKWLCRGDEWLWYVGPIDNLIFRSQKWK